MSFSFIYFSIPLLIMLMLSFSVHDVTPTQNSCGEDRFACDNGRCIYNGFRCDRIDDCGDASDERDCGMHFMLNSLTVLCYLYPLGKKIVLNQYILC